MHGDSSLQPPATPPPMALPTVAAVSPAAAEPSLAARQPPSPAQHRRRAPQSPYEEQPSASRRGRNGHRRTQQSSRESPLKQRIAALQRAKRGAVLQSRSRLAYGRFRAPTATPTAVLSSGSGTSSPKVGVDSLDSNSTAAAALAPAWPPAPPSGRAVSTPVSVPAMPPPPARPELPMDPREAVLRDGALKSPLSAKWAHMRRVGKARQPPAAPTDSSDDDLVQQLQITVSALQDVRGSPVGTL